MDDITIRLETRFRLDLNIRVSETQNQHRPSVHLKKITLQGNHRMGFTKILQIYVIHDAGHRIKIDRENFDLHKPTAKFSRPKGRVEFET